MSDNITTNYAHLEEVQLHIQDNETLSYGGSQYWFPKKLHQLSGCGPIAAANITAYLSQQFPEKYKRLYPYEGAINKTNFLEHMIEIRKFVVPGWRGLTSVKKFAESTMAFAEQKSITLIPHILEDDTINLNEAVGFIAEALEQRLPIAILVLTHPLKEMEDYAWHWMTITHLAFNVEDGNFYIIASSYGERHKINFNMLWNNRRRKDKIRLAYFT